MSDNFNDSLAAWIKGFCDARAHEDRLLQREVQFTHEIKWLEDQIVALAQEYPKRPSVIHQIEQYRYEIRHKELSLVFRT
jgi:hypothetical protein